MVVKFSLQEPNASADFTSCHADRNDRATVFKNRGRRNLVPELLRDARTSQRELSASASNLVQVTLPLLSRRMRETGAALRQGFS
jgi:hypothetical protein